jgi:hypothetical protein
VHVSVAQRVRQHLALAATPTMQQKKRHISERNGDSGVRQPLRLGTKVGLPLCGIRKEKKRHMSVAQRVRQHLALATEKISKILSIVILHSKCTRVLTFEKFVSKASISIRLVLV